MWEEIIRLAASNGLWAVLFCALLFYELKDSRKRESKYVDTISTLGKKLDVVNSVKEDTERLLQIVSVQKAANTKKTESATAEKADTKERAEKTKKTEKKTKREQSKNAIGGTASQKCVGCSGE